MLLIIRRNTGKFQCDNLGKLALCKELVFQMHNVPFSQTSLSVNKMVKNGKGNFLHKAKNIVAKYTCIDVLIFEKNEQYN